MYLKEINIHGFKSFADDIKIKFNKGITAIVGPNGCGKSNVTDAMRWVLGEKSIKSLRGDEKEDLIFKGSEKRDPINRAEVRLVFDNSDKLFNLDYNEVTISRIIYRDGNSEFKINNNLCRLKDIRNLILDTGLGTSAYSFIEQGRIGQIVQAKPQERRLLFEEASGISKYRVQVKETMNKLDRTKEDLERINDIIVEIESQLRVLKRQANKAKRAKKIKEELLTQRTLYYKFQYYNLKTKLSEYSETIMAYTKKRDEMATQIDSLESKKETIRAQLLSLDKNSSKYRNQIAELTNKITQNEAAIKIYKERIKADDNAIEEKENNNVEYKTRINSLNDTLEKIYPEKDKLVTIIDEIDTELNELNKHHQDLIGKINNLENIMSTNESSIEEYRDKIDKVREEIISDKTRREHIKYDLKNKDEEFLEYHNKLKDMKKTTDDLNQKNKKVIELLNETKSGISELITKRNNLNDSLETDENNINICSNEIYELNGKLSSLRDMEKNYIGYFDGVKNLLLNKNDINGIINTIANLITVHKGYEKCIETYLGNRLQIVLVENSDSAKEAINYLKDNNSGKATLLPRNINLTKKTFVQNNDIKKLNGFKNYLTDIISFSDDLIETYIYNQICNTVVFDNSYNANEAYKHFINHKIEMNIVTLDGDIFRYNSTITGGSVKGTGNIFLTRKKVIHDIETQLIKLQDKKEKLSHKITKYKTDIKDIETQLDELNIKSQKYTNEMNEYNFKINSQINSTEELEEKYQKIKSVIDTSQNELDNLTKKLENNEKLLDEMKQKNISLIKGISDNEKEYKSLLKEKDKFHNQLIELNKKMSAHTQIKNDIDNQIESNNNQIELFNSNIRDNLKYIEDCQNRIENSRNKIEILEKTIKDDFEALSEYKSELTSIEGNRETDDTKIQDIDTQLKTLNKSLNEVKEIIHNIDLKRTEAEVNIKTIIENFEHNVGYSISDTKNDVPDNINIPEIKEHISGLERKMERIGGINELAIEEYHEKNERFEFYTTQRDDLLKAIDDLKKVIRKLNKESRLLLKETFDKAKEHFKELFVFFFGGGAGRIYTDNEEDILEAGIDIEAQPPGKKKQNISSMSGGEQALVAAVLLFSLFMVKPTPFCVLDEVDAPLDDTNIKKYTEVLKKFSKETQFIVITHNKLTMSMANYLYGITMVESGVSNLVSVRLDAE